MHELFREYVETLHPSFEKLLNMPPVKIGTLPKAIPKKCIYLFSEGANHLYVGRTRRLRQRLREHSVAGALHNQAVFAFRLAREITGQTIATYSVKGSRKALSLEGPFADAFTLCKTRVRNMDLRFIEEIDPLRQALLEIYVAVVLGTKYNDFDTH
jgi:predicted GIY-YIG superfamily endonuclease